MRQRAFQVRQLIIEILSVFLLRVFPGFLNKVVAGRYQVAAVGPR